MANCYCCKQRYTWTLPDPRRLRYDQDKYSGRFMELFQLTNPIYLFYLPSHFKCARHIINTIEVDGYRPWHVTNNQIWQAKTAYDSTFGRTGQKVQFFARPKFYVPLKTLLFFGMLTYYKDPMHLIAFQVINQAFNLNVIRNQRNPPADPTTLQQITSFLFGSLASASTAFYLQRYLRAQCATKLMMKLVPFFAVAAAHCVSTPFIRAQEMFEGKPVFDCCGCKLGVSKFVSHKSVTLDILVNILKVAPPLVLTPYALDWMKNNGTMCRFPWLKYPAPIGILFVSLALISPLVGAFFRQRRTIAFSNLDHELRCKAASKVYYGKTPDYVCYCAGPPLPF
ncbi:unnamed protein product [Psylliodes chrysocephalus]|uniref:Sidoreflexin n=1 Tax=Psylliodes chrysocephalus TaxID=3402493 RepID=A0A9P0D916_9CUCU|nr:unnamed protein product [Psylliodes chrysocephala]